MTAEADPVEAAPATWSGLNVVVLSPTPTYPLDAGNRRRVFHLTRSLRELGAHIVFVHYPSEGEWRDGAPMAAVAAMSSQWDAHYTVPITMRLHPQARAEDHLADEWWDPAISDMLDWIFRTHLIDVLIVNYTWLSRAFERCPAGVLRVLDTHDRFSGRRQVLASAGIAPEFFHTTEAEERKALARAHVIWSIKPQEAEFFTSFGMRHVVNMPHFEPAGLPWATRPHDGVIRFGMVGSANNINVANANAFIAAIRKYVARTLLPCEIVIGGGICKLLEPPGVPWIRLLGYLPDLAEFYQDVDVVVAPISVSTGLKIKVGEALCRSKAVVALAHAFEGYAPRHAFHTLASLEDMMDALRRIVNEPALVPELERLSALVARDIETERAHGLAITLTELGRPRPGVCVVIPLDDLFEGSMALDHALEVAACLGRIAAVSVFVDGEAGADWDAAPFHLLTTFGHLILAPHPAQARTDRRLRGLQLRRALWLPLATLMRLPQVAFWFASTHHAWDMPAATNRTRAYLNLDLAAMDAAEADMPKMLAQLAASFHEVVTLSRRGLSAFGGARAWRVPNLWRGEWSGALARLQDAPRESIAILADTADDPLLALTWSVVSRLSSRRVEIVLARDLAGEGGAMPGATYVPLLRCFTPDGIDPALVIDISSDHRMECAREIVDRSGLPCVTLFSDLATLPRDPSVIAATAAGVLESTALLANALSSVSLRAALVADRAQAGNYRNDAGWTCVLAEIEELAELVMPPPQAATEDR